MKRWRIIGRPIATTFCSKIKNDLSALIISHRDTLIKIKEKCWEFPGEVKSILSPGILYKLSRFHLFKFFFNFSQWIKVKYTICRSHFLKKFYFPLPYFFPPCGLDCGRDVSSEW